MISPMSSEGLFQNVIAAGGALAWQKKLKTNNIDNVKEIAEKVKCSGESIEIIVECLKTVSKHTRHTIMR